MTSIEQKYSLHRWSEGKKMIPSVTLCGPDYFSCSGVAALLMDVYDVLTELLYKDLTVLVLPRMMLSDVVGYCCRLNTQDDYIVVGHPQVRHLLENGSILHVRAFINIEFSVPEIFKALKCELIVSEDYWNDREIVQITRQEQVVLNYLMKGMRVVEIAHLTGRSVATISCQKRSVMRKLHVLNDQALHYKLELISRLENGNHRFEKKHSTHKFYLETVL